MDTKIINHPATFPIFIVFKAPFTAPLLLKSSNFVNIPINRFSQPVWISEIVDVFNQFNFNYDFKLVKNYEKCYENSGLLYSKEVQLENLKEFIHER